MLRNVIEKLLSLKGDVLALDPADLREQVGGGTSEEDRILRIEMRQQILLEVSAELLDSVIKTIRAVQVVARGFDLPAQNILREELDQLGKIEDKVLRQLLTSPQKR